MEQQLRVQVAELKSSLRWLVVILVAVVAFLFMNLSSNVRDHEKSLNNAVSDCETKLAAEQKDYATLLYAAREVLSDASKNHSIQQRQSLNMVTRYAAPSPGRLLKTVSGSPHESDDIRAMAVLHFILIVIRDTASESAIEIYDATTNQFIQEVAIAGMGELSDMTSCLSRECVYITDSTNHAVYRLTLEQGKIKYTKWPVSYAPRCVSETISSNVLITYNRIAAEYSPSGELQRAVYLQSDVKDPKQVIELDVDRYLVSDTYLNSNRLCIVDEFGQKLKCVKIGSADVPIHVAVNGFIFITDLSDDSVMMLTSSLTYVRDVVNNLKQPHRLLVVDELLYVADFDEEDSQRLTVHRIAE